MYQNHLWHFLKTHLFHVLVGRIASNFYMWFSHPTFKLWTKNQFSFENVSVQSFQRWKIKGTNKHTSIPISFWLLCFPKYEDSTKRRSYESDWCILKRLSENLSEMNKQSTKTVYVSLNRTSYQQERKSLCVKYLVTDEASVNKLNFMHNFIRNWRKSFIRN